MLARWSLFVALGSLLTPSLLFAESPVFFRAIDLNGPDVEIDGHRWQGKDSKQYRSDDRAFENQDVPLIPETDPSRALMLRSSRWNSAVDIRLTSRGGAANISGIEVWRGTGAIPVPGVSPPPIPPVDRPFSGSNTVPSGIDRNAFNAWKRKYWMDRANDFGGSP